jgi:peptidoglycan/xylan/chitin deacetylase (PgdA/CDA1 family)
MYAEPGRRRLRAAVLTYHAIDESGSVLSTSPRLFALQMQILAESGVRIVPLTDLPNLISAASTSAPVVALTFDDGLLSVYEHALPVIARYGYPATVFVVSDYCGRTNAWPSQPTRVAQQPLMGWRELRELARAGVRPGCHTRSHPDLRSLPPSEMSEQLTGAKARIEDALGVPVDSFAYPYGAHDYRVRLQVAAHFSLACATTLGFVGSNSDRFALERLDMYYLRRPALLARLFTSPVRGYLRVRRSVRDLRAHGLRP